MRFLKLALGVLTLSSYTAFAEPVMISDAERPNWLSVGRVNVGGFKSASLCSGVLIGPAIVLTAAHCVANPETGVAFQPYKIRFVAGWHKGEFAAVGKAKSVLVHPDYGARPVGSLDKIEVDLALITLQEPLSDVAPAPVNLSDAPFKEGPVRILGYRVDRPHAISDYLGCSAYALRRTMLSIDCAVVKGTSGAPVFAERDGVYEVVGIVSSRLEKRGRDKALAPVVAWVKSVLKTDIATSNP